MGTGESLAFTPSWAVASLTALLVALSLLLETLLHLLSHFVDSRRRKTLNLTVDQLKSGLRNMGFITLLLTVAKRPVSKICIPKSLAGTFLPCNHETPLDESEALEVENTCDEGKIPILSPNGTQQLQVLIMMLAVFHLTCSLITLGLREMKMKKWELWEAETNTLDHKLTFDNRRFMLTKETVFGRRHLKFWSNNVILLWIVCLLRQFTGSVSKADYFALRRGFINAHLGTNTAYNFHKFLRRTFDNDFKAVVTISLPLWTYVVFFIFLSAEDFRVELWLPIIPFVVLLVIGAKLEAIITKMCLTGSKHMVIISGEVSVKPNDKLFWFGKPQLLLYAIQFILIENSFQIAFIIWDTYTFGFPSCLHGKTQHLAISIAISLLVQFMCAYVTLPLYALVSQMGSSMKETILADQVVAGLKHWHAMAKRTLSPNGTILSIPSSPLAKPSSISSPMNPLQKPRALLASSSASPALQSPRGVSSSYHASPTFEFPMERRELEEIQKVTEEMMKISRNSTVGEISFRMWWAQEISSGLDSHSSLARWR
ncbi:MLO-like protein 12 isoform X2 [Phalaenopsis equestris]|uniref:MLO-like protein 12 isoform X2 n=1 Tax=Phalaenopsis equestris TaxID=78828 RepID=UPI0009E35D43|nr:MLO-like protein 12 isoform X2 [Phalaenopsis equestris]